MNRKRSTAFQEKWDWANTLVESAKYTLAEYPLRIKELAEEERRLSNKRRFLEQAVKNAPALSAKGKAELLRLSKVEAQNLVGRGSSKKDDGLSTRAVENRVGKMKKLAKELAEMQSTLSPEELTTLRTMLRKAEKALEI